MTNEVLLQIIEQHFECNVSKKNLLRQGRYEIGSESRKPWCRPWRGSFLIQTQWESKLFDNRGQSTFIINLYSSAVKNLQGRQSLISKLQWQTIFNSGTDTCICGRDSKFGGPM